MESRVISFFVPHLACFGHFFIFVAKRFRQQPGSPDGLYRQHELTTGPRNHRVCVFVSTHHLFWAPAGVTREEKYLFYFILYLQHPQQSCSRSMVLGKINTTMLSPPPPPTLFHDCYLSLSSRQPGVSSLGAGRRCCPHTGRFSAFPCQ